MRTLITEQNDSQIDTATLEGKFSRIFTFKMFTPFHLVISVTHVHKICPEEFTATLDVLKKTKAANDLNVPQWGND